VSIFDEQSHYIIENKGSAKRTKPNKANFGALSATQISLPQKMAGTQAAEKVFGNVILSEARNLALKRINYLRDPSSPSAPQDDPLGAFFRSL
jgi:hypothetical protein